LSIVQSVTVSNIQGYSIHDGPGIRTTVFLKGCPLSCKWCSNPENLSGKVEMGFIESLCVHCGRCQEVCPNGAIRPGEGEYRIDHFRCLACGLCRDNCYYGALVRYGEVMTVDEVWDAVRRDKMFYEASGGGVTVSGGEPLLQAHFVRELFELCRMERIGACVETCGFASPEAFLEVLPVTDCLIFDLKQMDTDIHRRYTGQANDQILENAALVVAHCAEVIFRQPLIPGINDSLTNIDGTAKFLHRLGEKAARLQLMPYHRMGQSKYRALNVTYDMDGIAVMEDREIEAVKNAYIDRGIDCTISR
jgi:pyruvate formate lyase activating enzyme